MLFLESKRFAFYNISGMNKTKTLYKILLILQSFKNWFVLLNFTHPQLKNIMTNFSMNNNIMFFTDVNNASV